MAEQKILISIQINDRQNKKTNDALKVTKENFDKLTKAEQDAIIADKQLSLAAKQLDKSLTQKAAAANAAAAATDKMRATSGLNNAIIMETSRLASDASYGFTAIANNLSQLINLFQSQVTATGSLASTFKNLISVQSLALIGIQLLITYAPKLFDLILNLAETSGQLKFILKTFGDAGKTVRESAGNFELYTKTLQDATKSQEEKNLAIKKLKKEFPDYINQLDQAGVSLKDVADNTKEAKKQNDLYRQSIVKLAMARAAEAKIQELQSEIITIKAQEEIDEEIARNAMKVDQAKLTNEELSKADEKAIKLRLSMAESAIQGQKYRNKQEIDLAEKRINALIKYTKLEEKVYKDGSDKRNRIFKMADLDFEKETQKSRERLLKSLIDDEKVQTRLKFSGIKERARLKQKEFEDDQKRRLDDYLKSIKDDENYLQKKKDAEKKYDEEIKASKKSLSVYIVQLNQEEATAITNIGIKESQEIQKINRQKLDAEAAYLDEKNRMNGKYSFFQTERNIETLTTDVAAQQAIVDSHAVGTIEREQAELRLFELKKQLNAEEQALAEQKFAYFNQQYTSITDALSQTFAVSAKNETIALEESYGRRIAAAEGDADAQERLQKELAEKKDKIARKQFKVDQAMKIGRALMDTYQSAWLAFGSQLVVGDPTSPVRARVAQAVALAAGLANVANIARQKYQSSIGAGGSSGGGGGGGTTIQAPDFNVVGASQTSQLAQAVTTQQQKPVKAFVVGKDISTQQELDRNITNTASFG